MNNWKNLQMRTLRGKQFGNKGGMPSKTQMVPDLSKKLIKAKRVKEVVLVHVWLFGIKALLGTFSYFWPGPSTFIEPK
jgi:hypothetical protein